MRILFYTSSLDRGHYTNYLTVVPVFCRACITFVIGVLRGVELSQLNLIFIVRPVVRRDIAYFSVCLYMGIKQ